MGDYSTHQFRRTLDSIHGLIEFPVKIWDVIDTPVYQRLRRIKQLGTAHYVFMTASHSRFEHCLGTGHVAKKYVEHFQNTQRELGITSRDVLNVTLAGILHDLGHGPFSHLFDNEIVPALGITQEQWTHEQASVQLFEYIVDKYSLDFDEYDKRQISDMILGSETKGFLYQIVNNKQTSLDVDKFDYLRRDAANVGYSGVPFDYNRLLLNSKVIGNVICYNKKIVHTVYSVFQDRFSLFQQVYSHKVGQAIGLMIRDAVLNAESVLNLRNVIQDPTEYWKLTDDILYRLEESTEPELNKTREILNNIKLRKLYKCVGEAVNPSPQVASEISDRAIAESSDSNAQVNEDDLIVMKFSLTYANPANETRFFTGDKSFVIPENNVSQVLPANYRDNYIRVFVKDPKKKEAASIAFKNFMKRCRAQVIF